MLGDRYRVDPKSFALKKCPTDDPGEYTRKTATAKLAEDVEQLQDLQDRFYAFDRYSLLLVFQALDAAGKDGTVKHVMSGINPAGCEVHSFKAPSAEELDHDFMWRTTRRLPERGRIGIFNRSYYEEVLVARVHPEILAHQHLPAEVVTKRIWEERYKDINNFERYLARNGTRILKFYLHVSKHEQKRRFLQRIEDPARNWKFSQSDLRERALWDDYQEAYEQALLNTSTDWAPWFVIPADRKWYSRLVVAEIIVNCLKDIDPQYPEVTAEQRASLEAARQALEAEDQP
ncbi:polyphosphate kinase 2 family protein [Candidatus Poribacteria bacterium]|nr:polyphosphate kinase 2 family protein [Candidatus Poribacteria bacterium]